MDILNRKRGSAKRKVTAFQRFVKTYQIRIDTGDTFQEQEIIELRQRFDKIGEVRVEFEGYQDEIECRVSEEEYDAACSEREVFDQVFFSIISQTQYILNKYERQSVVENPLDIASLSRVQTDTGTSDFHRVKLPMLNLPQFDGSYDKWGAFHDTFKSVIHSSTHITDIEKFQYLHSALSGDAVQVIQGLEISSANYTAAWDLLTKRYQNTTLSIHNHIKGIVDYPKISKSSFHALRKLLNCIQGHLRSLQTLNQDCDKWGSLLIYIIADKFDIETRTEWEKNIDRVKMPEVSKLINFIEERCHFLEKTDRSTKDLGNQIRPYVSRPVVNKGATFSHATTDQPSCPICNSNHPIYTCMKFQAMPIDSRIAEIKRHRRCLKCFRANHFCNSCKSPPCFKCKGPHHTLLHRERTEKSQGQQLSNDASAISNIAVAQSSSTHFVENSSNTSHVLPTAVVQMFDASGRAHDCIALLDSGSQSNFLSERLVSKLQLRSFGVNLSVIGVSGCKSDISKSTRAAIASKHSDLKVELDFLVSKQVTSILPSEPLDLNKLNIPAQLALADPQFHKPKNIDLLLGVDIFWDLLCPEPSQLPYLHKTKLGYIISGRVPRCGEFPRSTVCNFSSDLSQQLSRFWDLEDFPKQEKLTSEEKRCESIFTETIHRNEDGRFIVTIPLKKSLDLLGESKNQAETRFLALERKLQRNEPLRLKYSKFMDEYESLGHMSKIDPEAPPPKHAFYLPHHGVLKEESLTTKLRVVFDGSASSSTGVSLNDLHMTGPTIQPELLSTLLRF